MESSTVNRQLSTRAQIGRKEPWGVPWTGNSTKTAVGRPFPRTRRAATYDNQSVTPTWEETSRNPGGLRLDCYSVFPRCSVAAAVNLPNKPFDSSFGPAVKYSSVADPDLALPPAKLRAHRPSIITG